MEQNQTIPKYNQHFIYIYYMQNYKFKIKKHEPHNKKGFADSDLNFTPIVLLL